MYLKNDYINNQNVQWNIENRVMVIIKHLQVSQILVLYDS